MDELLAAYVAGGLDEAGAGRLLEICRGNPAAAELLAGLVDLERALVWRHAARGGEEFAREVLLRLQPDRGRSSGFVRAVLDRVGPRTRGRFRWMFATAAALLAGAVVFLWRVTPWKAWEEAHVAEVEGNVELLSGGGRHPARAGAVLAVGNGIRTGAQGRADIRYPEGTRLRLGEETEAWFGRVDGDRRVNLRGGLLRGDVVPLPPGQIFRLTTPHAEAAVLGTSFELLVTAAETRLRTIQGRVRFASGDREVLVRDGGLSTAGDGGIRAWASVAAFDFPSMTLLPPRMEAVFCPTELLHTPGRRVEPAPDRVAVGPAGLEFATGAGRPHGLIVARLAEEVGEDVAVEAEVAGGQPWTLGLAVAGDSFEGYRIIFSALGKGDGIAVDTIHPWELSVLTQSAGTIAFDRDRVLRVEKVGNRIRVWVDRELRIDTEVSRPLPEGRRRTVALSNFGGPPRVRSLRIWRATGG